MAGSSDIRGQKPHRVPEKLPEPSPSRTTHGTWGHVHNTPNSIPFLRNYLEQYGLDKIMKERLISHAWHKGTVKLPTNYLKKRGLYCLLHKVKPLKPSIAQILRFLRLLEDEGLGFSAINAARCALSIILPRIEGETVGKHQLIHWFMRSVYERNPPKQNTAGSGMYHKCST